MRSVTRNMTWVLLAVWCVAARATVGGQQNGPGFKIDNASIGGTVVNSNGGKPEAGVWVITESKDLPATLRKIVATDDQGRYLVPDLPKGNYSVWVRGYGLVDSSKVSAAPGKQLNLTAVPAPNAKAAADYYPALYGGARQ